jgi:CRISPR-associated protein Cas2
MVIIVLTACPAGLRGHLTRWLLEISAGVFVGTVSARVRELMWTRVTELSKDGRAIMVHSAQGEQRLAFRVHRHDWTPIDIDGIHLMLRPADPNNDAKPRPGWSSTSHRRRNRQRSNSSRSPNETE